MSFHFFTRGSVAAMAVLPLLAAAEPVTLAVGIDAAWRRAVAATQADNQLNRARSEQRAAAARWAAPPSVEIAHRSDRLTGNRGERETELGVAVPIWLPGQRAARLGAADAGETLAQASRAVARLRIAGQVRETAWQTAQRRQETALAQQQVDAAAELAADVDRRVAAGDLARADALDARADLLAARTTLIQARQQLLSATLQWTALTGLEHAPDELAPEAEPIPSARHPALVAAEAGVDAARRRLDVVKATRSSPPEVLGRVVRESPGRGEAGATSVGVALRLPLGTPDRQAPLLADALAELELAQTTLATLRLELDAELRSARALVRSTAEQNSVERQRAELLRERAMLILRSFRAGETPLPDTLRAMSAARQAEAAARRQDVLLGLAHARLNQALGVVP